jgi:tetratricopeptide (TPR) repeat protein
LASALIPTTLHGLLLARFDHCDRGKDVAQVGAVIGREFSLKLLRAVAGLDDTDLRLALDQLVDSGLLFRRGSSIEATFVFKHALVRDAAYGTLPRERRRTLHAGLARAYEENLADTALGQPELLAHHWKEGGDPVKAVGYLLIASERALYRSATTEALSHLAQARELISDQPADRHRLRLELTLELTSARALLATRGYTATETRQAYQRAREYCEVLGDQSSLPLIIHGQWLAAWTSGDHPSALARAREFYSWGERNCDQVGFVMAHSDLAITLTTLGRLEEARSHLDQALEINAFVLPGRQPFVASDVDGRVSALSFMHHCLLLLGFPEKAKAAANEVASLNAQNLYSQALARTRTLRMHFFERNAPAVAEMGPAVVSLCQKQGYPHFGSTAMIYSGWSMAQCGDPTGGAALAERGLAQLQNLGAKCWWPLNLALLAECYEQSGDWIRAAEFAAEALKIVESSGELLWESEIYRLKGRLLLSLSDSAGEAIECFVTALDKARAQKAKLLELRAAISLAKLLIRERRPNSARDVLAVVYGSFSEGFDFADLREAKLLLDALSESCSNPEIGK